MKISIDGNFGVGKTYHLQRLATEGYCVHWSKPSPEFQLESITTYMQMLQPFIFNDTNERGSIVLYERSPYTLQRIYTDLRDPDDLFQYQQSIKQVNWSPDIIIYLFCHPMICKQRTKNLSDEILVEFHNRYENILDELNCSIPIYKINAQEDLDQVFNNIIDVLHQVRS